MKLRAFKHMRTNKDGIGIYDVNGREIKDGDFVKDLNDSYTAKFVARNLLATGYSTTNQPYGWIGTRAIFKSDSLSSSNRGYEILGDVIMFSSERTMYEKTSEG